MYLFSLLCAIAAQPAWQIATERQHRHQRGLRHRRAMDAADVGDDHVRGERGLVGDAVDAGAERLDPPQLGGVVENRVLPAWA